MACISTVYIVLAASALVGGILSPQQMTDIIIKETLAHAIPDFVVKKPTFGYNFSRIVIDNLELPPFKISNCSVGGQWILDFEVDDSAALAWHSSYDVYFASDHPKDLSKKKRTASGSLTALCTSLLLQLEAYYDDSGRLKVNDMNYIDMVPTDYRFTNFTLGQADYAETVDDAYNAFGWQFPSAFYNATFVLVDRLNKEGLDWVPCG